MGVADEGEMVEGGRGGSEGFVDEDLSGGRKEEVLAADDFRDAHRDVVDDHGKFVGGDVVAIPDEEVAEVGAGSESRGAEALVGEGDPAVIRDAEAPIRAARLGIVGGCSRGRAPGRWVDWFFVLGVGGLARAEVAAGTGAGVDAVEVAEAMPSVEVEVAAVTLKNGFAVPVEAEPEEVFERGVDEFGATAGGVEIFDSENDSPAGRAGAAVGEGKGPRVAEMEMAGGRGGEAGCDRLDGN